MITNLIGKVYGKLTVTGICPITRRGMWWYCKCACGIERPFPYDSLRSGVISCGCSRKKPLAKHRMSGEESAFRKAYRQTRMGATLRNLSWSLTEDEVRLLFESPCYYCGVVGYNKSITDHRIEPYVYSYNGIDRVDNSEGYIASNVVACCSMCNKAKHTHSQAMFIKWIHQAHEHLVNRTY